MRLEECVIERVQCWKGLKAVGLEECRIGRVEEWKCNNNNNSFIPAKLNIIKNK